MVLPNIKVEADSKEFTGLTEKLKEHGYIEENIAKFLGRWDISEMNGREYPNYVWRCRRDDSDLATLIGFFLMGQASTLERIGGLIGQAALEALLKCGVLLDFKKTLTSQAVIYPCLGRYFITDYWVSEGTQPDGKVYELGTDSYVLARITPRENVTRALDLCTGSGIHAVLSASSAETSQAIDINPRALIYTALNARLNSVTCEPILSDLYTEVKGQKYDLITANPPFVPSPDPNVRIHRSAGETGEEVPERLVKGLPEMLAEGGLFSMVLEHPVYEDETYLDRLERWLGEKTGWCIAVLTFVHHTPANYVIKHLGGVEDYTKMFEAYLESYERNNIIGMRFANVFIRRLPPERPNVKVNQFSNWPNESLVERVSEWLDCLNRYSDPDWRPDPSWKPDLGHNYKYLWRDWDHAQGVLEMGDHNWFRPDPLNADEAELLVRLRGGVKTIETLTEEWLDGRGDESSFLQALRGLGLRRALSPLE